MKDVFQAVQVTEKVYWVGAIDWSVRDFHGYLTSSGTTYNAYLILAEKVTLMDTVKAGYAEEMLARIASVIDPKKIDYLVSNHSEPDHAGSIAKTIEAIEPETVFASKKGVEALGLYFDVGEQVQAVADGQQLSLGDRTLTFAETRLCHWPDSMVSYLHEDQMLISQDAFGMHLASYKRFADEMDPATLDYEARKYYANILLPLSGFVAKSIAKLQDLGVPISIICPDHGPIWRQQPEKIVQDYLAWAEQKRNNKAVVVYDTMWKSTELLARAVGEGLAAGGASPKLCPLAGNHRSDVATELLDAGALVVGAPTLNKQVFPTLADCLTYVTGLQPKGLLGGAFGSYGWGGEATGKLSDFLQQMGVETVTEPIRSKYAPDAGTLKACYDMGAEIAGRIA